jgi:hypothetical protein
VRVRAADAGGCDDASFWPEPYKRFCFECSFGNDDRSTWRIVSWQESEVYGRTRAGAAAFEGRGEPSVFLFAGGNINRVKSNLSCLDQSF